MAKLVPILCNLQVIHGCEPNAWHMSPDGTSLNLLHKAILLKDTTTACFLIRSGADINSHTRPSGKAGNGDSPMSPTGKGEGQFSSPLHMACERGLHEVVRCLLEHKADVNARVSLSFMRSWYGRAWMHASMHMQYTCMDMCMGFKQLSPTVCPC